MGYIYKITNDINDKVYVGKTLSTIEERWKVHCQDAKRKRVGEIRPLYRAMNKYGVEHFKIEVINEYNEDILSDMENYWIEYYHGFTDGYNATKGGDGKTLYDHSAILKKLLESHCVSEVVNEFGCCADTVRQIAKNNSVKLINPGKERLRNLNKPIQQISKNGEIINVFSSVVDASRWCFENGLCKTLNSGVRSHISDVAKGKRKTAYQYYWCYV